MTRPLHTKSRRVSARSLLRERAFFVFSRQERRTMTDNQSQADDQTPPAGTDDQNTQSQADTTSTDATTNDQTTDAPNGVDALPKWAQDLIEGLRKESGKHRTGLRKLEQDRERQAAQEAEQKGEWETLAKTRAAEVETLQRQLSERDHRDLRNRIATKHKLSQELADRLKGETEDEIEADAKHLAQIVRPTAPDTETGKGAQPPSRRPGSNGATPATAGKTVEGVQKIPW